MQAGFKDGSSIVCGGCNKDAEIELVGDDNKRVCKVGLAVGKDGNDKTIWANVTAWHGLAAVLSKAKKGDPVFVIGKLKTREYNGKTYTDLIADYVNVCSLSSASNRRAAFQPADGGINVPGPGDFGNQEDADGELPF